MGDWADDELDNAFSSDDPWEGEREEMVLECGVNRCV